MKANDFLNVIETNSLEDSFDILLNNFKEKSEEITSLILVQRNLYRRVSRDLSFDLITPKESEDEIKTIKNNLKTISTLVEQTLLNKIIAQNLQFKSGKKPNIFISYSWRNKDIADEIDKEFIDIGFNLIRDIRDVKYTQSLKLFMQQVRETDYVLMILSKDYLESVNCMYEVTEIMKELSFKTRILPILENGSILSIQSRKQSIDYWKTKAKELRNSLKGMEPSKTISLFKELAKIEDIYRQIDTFLEIISDMLCLTFDNLKNSKYEDLFNKVGISKVNISINNETFRLARLYYKRASLSIDHEDKIIKLSKAIELDKRYTEAYVKRADAFYELRIYDKAIEDLTIAIDIDPNDEGLYNERGVNYRMNKQFYESIDDFNKAIKARPNYEEAYSNRGLSWENVGEYERAIDDFKKAIEINKNFKFAYNNLGFTMRKLKRYNEAIYFINKALEIDNSYGFAYANLAEIAAEQGNRILFLENVEKALTNNCPVGDYLEDTAYDKFIKDKDFLKLLSKYKYPTFVQTKY